MLPSPSSTELRWRGLLIAGLLLALTGLALVPRLGGWIGLPDFGRWFLDSYAVLAAVETVQAGEDSLQPMTRDIFHRPHCYTDWWFALRHLGLGRADNFPVGGAWVLAFAFAAFTLLRPNSGREFTWYLLLLLSPPVLLALNRANNDLVIFALLAIAAGALRRSSLGRLSIALGAIALATGLKVYPVVGAAALVLLRPRHLLVVGLVVGTVVLTGVLLVVWPFFSQVRADFVPPTLYVFGAPVLLQDMGAGTPGWRWLGFGVVAGAAAILAMMRRRDSGVLLESAHEDGRAAGERAAFMLGTSVLLGCFLAGNSFAYRWVFVLLAAPALWRSARVDIRARLALGLVPLLLWCDGLFCLTVNTAVDAVSPERLLAWERHWRLLTHPLVWVLMILLASWWWQIAWAGWKELRHRN